MLAKFTICTIFVLHLALPATTQHSASCVYFIETNNEYSCNLTITNPNGFDNFTRIEGQHLSGFGNTNVGNVRFMEQSVTSNIPSIICGTFTNLRTFSVRFIGIREVGINSFRGCPLLINIELLSNNIERIATDAFINNPNVEWLDLQINNITELPENIFRPLSRLNTLAMFGNKVEIVHSNWFGVHHHVSTLGLANNRIHAIDRRILQAFPNARIFMMNANICADGLFRDPAPLEPCFENYDARTTTTTSSTTTTSPGDCVINDIFREVCSIRDDMAAMENRIRILERIVAGKSEEIVDLKGEVEELKELVTKMMTSEKLKS